MALVTYHGPRPEIVPAMPVQNSYVTEALVVVGPTRLDGRPKFASLYAPVFHKDRPTPCDPLYALGLAMIRRRPSPWFTIRMSRGEYAEVAHRLPLGQDCFDCEGRPGLKCDFCHGDGTIHQTFREATLSALHWSQGQIDELYFGDRKPLFVNGDLVWAPEGWRVIR